MGTVFSTKPPESPNNNDQNHSCNCFLLKFLKNRQTPVTAVNGENGSFELNGAALENGDDGIVSVPNEIKRDLSADNLVNYEAREIINQTSLNQIRTFLNESRSESSTIDQETADSMASQLALVRSQLAKTRRENKRLIGELKALRSAYAHIQVDQLHWKSQANLLLERAKIFEAQLKHRDSEQQLASNSLSDLQQISSPRRPSLTPSTISLPTITLTFSNNALPSLAEVSESTKSLNISPSPFQRSESEFSFLEIRQKHNCFCNSNAWSLANNVAAFVVASNSNAIQRLINDSNGIVRLRQRMVLNGQNLIVFVINNAKHFSADYLIENGGRKMSLWFVGKGDDDDLKSRISTDNWNTVIEFETGNDESATVVLHLPPSLEKDSFGEMSSEDQTNYALPLVLASVGQFVYAGYVMYLPNNSAFLRSSLQLDLALDSYYLSQLHLALRDPNLKSKRRFPVIFTCQDKFRLFTIMQSWISALSCSSGNNKSGTCNLVLAHTLHTAFLSERGAVMEAFYHFTRILIDKVELRPLIRYPSVSSVDKLVAEFVRSLQSFVVANSGKVGNVIIAIHMTDWTDDEAVFDKRQVFSMLVSFLNSSLPANCHVFIFTTFSIEEMGIDDEKVDTASQFSGSSEHFTIGSNIIQVAPLTPTDFLAVAKKLYCENRSGGDELERLCCDWVTNASEKSLSLTALHLKIRFICHMNTAHQANSPLESAFHSEVNCLLETWKHLLVENCFDSENASLVAELVALLAVSEKGLQTENVFLQVPSLTIEFWFRFIAVLEYLGLILCVTGNDSNYFATTESDLLPSVTCVKLKQQNELLALIRRCGNLAGLSLKTLTESRRSLILFYFAKLSSGINVSSHDVSDLSSMLLAKRLNGDPVEEETQLHSLVTNALAIHLLYHSGELVLVQSSNAHPITATTLSECQKMVMLNQVYLAPDTLRAHLLLSLAGVAADFGFANLSISFLADALDTIRSDFDTDKSLPSWATSVLAHLMIANITLENVITTDKSARYTTNGYRSTAERNVSLASKIIAKRNSKKASNAEDFNGAVRTLAIDMFSSHITVISLQLKQTVNINNKLE